MAKPRRTPFKKDGPFQARRYFLFDGVHYQPGDLFSHQDIKIYRLKRMWDNRMLDVIDEGDLNKEVITEKVISEVDHIVDMSEERDVEDHQNIESDESDPIDWRTLPENELLEYAYQKTGTKFRVVDRAIQALKDMET